MGLSKQCPKLAEFLSEKWLLWDRCAYHCWSPRMLAVLLLLFKGQLGMSHRIQHRHRVAAREGKRTTQQDVPATRSRRSGSIRYKVVSELSNCNLILYLAATTYCNTLNHQTPKFFINIHKQQVKGVTLQRKLQNDDSPPEFEWPGFNAGTFTKLACPKFS